MPLRTHPDAEYIRVFIRHRHELPDGLRHKIAALARDYQQLVEQLFIDGIASGELQRDLNPQRATLALLGLCNSVIAARALPQTSSIRRIRRGLRANVYLRRACIKLQVAAELQHNKKSSRVARTMSDESYKDVYRRANQYGKTSFLERPYFGSPGAPAQAETNISNIWGHINGGFLIGYEYTRWWMESLALRQTAILGDWSWLNKVRVTGPDAERFLNFATVKDISRQQIGQIMYTPMTNEDGKVAIEGLTWKFGDSDFIFTQSGAQSWLPQILQLTDFEVTLEDVTPDYTCFALQGPKATDILEALTGEDFKDMKFSRWRRTRAVGEDVLVGRQGVTGEVGYEFLMRTDTGKAHELWREIRRVGQDFGMRELGFKTQLIGHTETGIATVIRRFPAGTHERSVDPQICEALGHRGGSRRTRRRSERAFLLAGRTRLGIHHQSRQP